MGNLNKTAAEINTLFTHSRIGDDTSKSVFFGLKSERERNLEVYKYMYGQNIINSEIEDISYNLMKLFKRTVFK